MLEIKKKNLLINVFNNIDELDKFLKDKNNYKPERDDASQHNGWDFTGTHSYEQAEELFKYGDKKLFEEIKNNQKEMRIEKLLGNAVNKNKSFNDLIGFIPNVPLFLNNVPTNMINIRKNKTDLKVLNIYLNTSVSGGYNKDILKKVGTIYASVIDILEKKGFRINLYIGDSAEAYGEKFIWLLRIKTDREPLNLNKMAFPIAHPSMLRRIGFKYTEVCNTNNDFTHHGYGSPYHDSDEIQKLLEKYLKIKTLVFSYQHNNVLDINSAISLLKQKGIKIEDE